MGFFNELWDNTAGGVLWKPIKKATGLTDAQMIGLTAAAVAAPFAVPALMGAGAAGTAAAGTAAAGTAGATAGTAAASTAALGAPLSFTPAAAAAGVEGFGALAPTAASVGEFGAGAAGLTSGTGSGMTFAKGLDMAAKAAPIAQMGMGLLDKPQAPVQPGQVGRPGADFSGLLAQSPQTDEALRLQKRQMMIQGLLGGRYGAA